MLLSQESSQLINDLAETHFRFQSSVNNLVAESALSEEDLDLPEAIVNVLSKNTQLMEQIEHLFRIHSCGELLEGLTIEDYQANKDAITQGVEKQVKYMLSLYNSKLNTLARRVALS